MTSPGGDVPEGAYVGSAGQSNSIARLSDISEESAKSMMQGAAAPSFNRQRDAAWGVFNDIAYAITGVQVDENGNPITHIEDWATRDLHNLGTVVQDYGTAIEDLGKNRVMPWAVPTVAPLSQSINRRADPTFQLTSLLMPAIEYQGTPVAHPMARGGGVKNRVTAAFITPAVTRAYSQLNFLVGVVDNPCRMDIAIYVVDENRVLTRQVHKSDVLANLGTGEAVVTSRFDTFVAEQGSYIAIVWLQTGAGNPRDLLGMHDTIRPLSGAVFPPKIAGRGVSTSVTSMPSTINGESGLNFDFWFAPYAELSEDVGIDYKMFTESWGHGSIAPRPWVTLFGGIFSSAGGYAAAGSNGNKVSIYDTPLATDYVRVRTNIHTKNSNYQSALIIRGTNDLRSGIGLSATNRRSQYELISWSNRDTSSSWDDRTVIATINRAPQSGDTIEVDYLNGLVTVRINGATHLSDVAVGGPSGAAGRFVGIQTARGSDIFNTFHSPWFGPWSARDLPQDNGDDEDGEEDEGPIVGG